MTLEADENCLGGGDTAGAGEAVCKGDLRRPVGGCGCGACGLLLAAEDNFVLEGGGVVLGLGGKILDGLDAGYGRGDKVV